MVHPGAHIESVRIGWLNDAGSLVWEPRRFTELSSMWHVCKRFSADAEAGYLKCADWFDALETMGAQF